MKPTDTDDQVSADERGALMPKRRWPRRLLLLTGTLLVCLVVLVLLLPTLISTGVGKQMVMDSVSDQVAGEIDADTLTLGWRGGQQLTNVVVRDTDGSEVARIGRVDLPNVSLLALIRSGLGLGGISIEQVSADIVGYDDGTTNLQRALAPSAGKSVQQSSSTPTPSNAQAAWPEGLSFALSLRDVDVTYRAAEADVPIRLAIPQADLTANDPEHLLLKLDAELSRADDSGSLTVDATIDQLFDASGKYQPNSVTTHVDSKLTDLPVGLVDALLQEDGRLVTLLGPVVNGHVTADVTTTGGAAEIKADSEHLHIDSKVAFDDKGLKRDGESAIRYTLTPDAWAMLTTADGQTASRLDQPVDIAFMLNELVLPFKEQGIGLSALHLDVGLSISDARMLIDNVGEVTLESTQGSIKSARLGDSLTIKFNSVSGLNNKPGEVSLNAKLDDLLDEQNKFDPSRLSAHINGQLTNAPVAAILDELMPDVTKGLATRSLGRSIDAVITADAAPRSEGDGMDGTFEIDVLADDGEAGLNATLIGTLGYDKQAVDAALADGSYLTMTVSQPMLDRYQQAFAEPGSTAPSAEDPASRLTLGDPADLRLDLTKLAVSLNAKPDGGYALDKQTLALKGKIASPSLHVHQGGKLAATIRNTLIDIDHAKQTDAARLVLNAKVDYPVKPGQEPKPGSIKSDTTITGLIQDGEAFETAQVAFVTDTVIRQAPVDLLDALFGMNGEMIAAVGPRALLTVEGEYTLGDRSTERGLDVLMKSRSASADLKLLVEDEHWVLKNDAPLAFRVTPKLSQVLLKKINPFLGKAVSAQLPIDVTIKREGFSTPLNDITLNDINANLSLDLGELDLRGEGELKQVLDVLGVSGRSLANVRFTPFSLSLAGGKLSYENMGMGIDDVYLLFSGNVDLNSKALDLRMTIPGSSLSRISWLKGSIGEDEAIVIPLTGTFNEPTLDLKLMTDEIAKKALDKGLGGVTDDLIRDKLGDEAGAAVGGLLNEILGAGRQPQATDDESEPEADQPAADKQAQQPLTEEERAARKERRRLRRERLEREAAEREAQQQNQ